MKIPKGTLCCGDCNHPLSRNNTYCETCGFPPSMQDTFITSKDTTLEELMAPKPSAAPQETAISVVKARLNTSVERFHGLLKALENGDKISDEDLVWLHDEFNSVVQATTLFPQYKVVRKDAIGNLNQIRDFMHARGIVPPRVD